MSRRRKRSISYRIRRMTRKVRSLTDREILSQLGYETPAAIPFTFESKNE